MEPERTCNECGRPIPPDAPFCPRCLVELGVKAGQPPDPEDRLVEIFRAALGLTGVERTDFLDRACGDDAELRRQIDSLLAAHEQAGQAPLPPVAVQGLNGPAEQTGERIGRYKLLEPIGEGGMAVVWMAEQTEPVRRLVALKVIKPGMDSAQVLARFEAERQALALMDHPNIARILDTGATRSGRPYFVMDLVKGVPITRFCNEERLSVRERLDLFIPVCQAVQHAHQKGIIHRDLKPGNVLVALYDGKPVPKVIDFGVAKALGQRLTERTLYTQLGSVVGTLEYMSPEQAELNQLDVDMRSDIYSLGVLLYELLTGATPLTREALCQGALEELLRRIREEEPPKPSLRLSTSAERLPAISAQRRLHPDKLTKVLRGELDWIVMKALEKDRNRRYETASGFALDIQHYLNDEPVVAGPPTVRYRLKKFVRKHRRAVAAAAGFMALMVAASVVSTGLAWWAVRERDRAVQAQGTTLRTAALLLAEGHLRQVGLANTLSQFPPAFMSVPAPMVVRTTAQLQLPGSALQRVSQVVRTTAQLQLPRSALQRIFSQGIESAERHNLYEMQKYQRRVLRDIQLPPSSLPTTITPPILDLLEDAGE